MGFAMKNGLVDIPAKVLNLSVSPTYLYSKNDSTPRPPAMPCVKLPTFKQVDECFRKRGPDNKCSNQKKSHQPP